MDNPQETNNLNKMWLAGFFDTEGSISFNQKPMIAFENICALASFRVKEMLGALSINVGIHSRQVPSKSSKKPRWDIFLRDDEQIKVLVNALKMACRGKNKQLETLSDWYNGRISRDKAAEKLQFSNQMYNLISRPKYLREKLRTEDLNKYVDIQLLNEDDSYIVTSDFSSLDYAAGVLDGDGEMLIDFKAGRQSRYTPKVVLINSNKMIVKSYCSTLSKQQIGYHIVFRPPRENSRGKWTVETSGAKRVQDLLLGVSSLLYLKREQAQLILEYCKYRLSSDGEDEIGFECRNALEGMKKGLYG